MERRVFYDEQGVLAREESQGKEKSLSSKGSQDRSHHHYPNQTWSSVRKEVDAEREEGDARVRRE